jgi:hypothetical protein
MTNKKIVPAAGLAVVFCCGLIFTTCGKLETEENVYTVTFIAEYSEKETRTEVRRYSYGPKAGTTETVLVEVVVQYDAWSGKEVNVTGYDVERDRVGEDPVYELVGAPPPPTRRTDGDGRLTGFPRDPKRPGDWSFGGWFTQGGTQITKNTIFTTNTRVHAKWVPGAGTQAEEGLVALRFKEIAADLTKGQPDPGGYEVTITANESFSPITLELPNTYDGPKVRIILNGSLTIPDRQVTLPYLSITRSGSLFTVGKDVILELRNARMEGNDRNTTSLLTVNAGGKLIIGENELDKSYIFLNGSEGEKTGGGVTVNKGGELVMNGGEIYECSVIARAYDDPTGSPGGGGVNVRGGTFTMAGGNIERCYGRYNGGGVLVDLGGKFTMTGGQIYDNTAPYGGGVSTYRGGLFILTDNGLLKENLAAEGGGVFVDSGAEHAIPYDPRRPPGPTNNPDLKEGFYMEGGFIQGNHAVYDGGGVFNYQGGIVFMKGTPGNKPTITTNIADDWGGGVCNMGLYIMIDGDIVENRGSYGGGVCAAVNMFAFEAGNISNNRATAVGGGVFVLEGSFFMLGAGARLTTNTSQSFGGAAAIYYPGNFAMAGGEISGNRSTNYSPEATFGFFDSPDTKLLGLVWYGKRPVDPILGYIVPGDPAIAPVTEWWPDKNGPRPDLKNEVLLRSYLVDHRRDWTTGMVTELMGVPAATIRVENGKLTYSGNTPAWVTGTGVHTGHGYTEEYEF